MQNIPEAYSNSVKHLIWGVLGKQLTTKNRKLFLLNALSQIFDRVLSTPLDLSVNLENQLVLTKLVDYKSSHRRCSVKNVIKIFQQKLQENICVGFFFDKVAGLRSATLFKKVTQTQACNSIKEETPRQLFNLLIW